MPFYNYIAACLAFLLVLAACGRAPDVYQRPENITPIQITPSTPVPTLTPPPKTVLPFTLELRTGWLEGKPCAPPCWEGITPGKTRLSEALEVLNWHPQVRDIDVDCCYREGTSTVSWRWNGTSQAAGRLYFRQIDPHHLDDPIVTSIIAPSLARFTLGTIIDAYGEPSHIMPYADVTPGIPHSGVGGGRPYYSFTVIYQNHGFSLSTKDYYDVPPPINRGIRLLDEVVFFHPKAEIWDLTELVPWQGEQDFFTYCRHVQPHPPTCPD
jgi:hypothetical protein